MHKFTIWRTEESRNRSSEILIAISIAALAARSYRSLSYLLLLSGRSAESPTFSALSAAERQISRILCAASISPIGHSIFSSQTSLRLPLLNHLIAVPSQQICTHPFPSHTLRQPRLIHPSPPPN